MSNRRHYWLNTISLDHVKLGVESGFTQANHGSPYNLKRMQKGDGIVFYSPKQAMDGKIPLQEFTALGFVTDEEPYQVIQNDTFHPFRRNIEFENVVPVSIKPLIEELSFIQDKQKWGFIFRRGMFEIPEADFMLVSKSLGVNVDFSTN
jgi:predicted RNA-binding protein